MTRTGRDQGSPRSLTASAAGEPWRQRWEQRWHEAGDPPRPRVSQTGSPADVAARQWAAYVARAYPLVRPRH